MDKIGKILKSFYQDEKIELKSDKVELGVFDDFDKLINEGRKVRVLSKENSDKAISMAKELAKLISENDALSKKAIDIESKAESVWKDFSSKAKDLGVDPKSTPGFKMYNDILKELLLVNSDVAKAVKVYIK